MATRTMIEFSCDAKACTVVVYYPSGAYAKGMQWTRQFVQGRAQWYCPQHKPARILPDPPEAENFAANE